MRAWLLLFGLLSMAVATRAQQCPFSPSIPCTFVVIDVQTGMEVDQLCVGREVRFLPCTSRDPNLVYYYQVRQGANTPPNPCAFPAVPPTYRPTQAGTITVTENAQSPMPGGLSTIYFRNLEVKPSPAPTFTQAPCGPGFVRVTVPTTPYNNYAVEIGSGGRTYQAQPGQTAVYPVPPGATNVTVTGLYNDDLLCSGSATQPLQQLAAPGPLAIQRLSVRGSAVELETAPLTAGYRYIVERADAAVPAGWVVVPGAVQTSATQFTIANAPLGCYRLRREDDCGQAQATSARVCTLELTATALERRNQLTWRTDADPISYELTRNGTALPVPLQGSDRAYTDTALTCGVRYTYRLTGQYTRAVSVSAEVTVQATASQPPPAPRLLGSFDLRNRLELAATVTRFPSTGQLTYLRSPDVALATTPARVLRDSTLTAFNPDAAPCYQVRFADNCNNRSVASTPFCPAILAAELADVRGTAVRLRWAGLRGAPAGATPQDTLRYRLLVLAPDNSVLRSVPVSARGTYLDQQPPADQQTVRYRLEVSGAGLPAPSYSNVARAARRLEAYVPTAFTPNGDGLNDVLEVKGRFLTTFRFVVVDRNGQEIFRGTDKTQTWDGRIRNEKPVPGAYVWRFEAQDDAGQTVVQQGTVTIVK